MLRRLPRLQCQEFVPFYPSYDMTRRIPTCLLDETYLQSANYTESGPLSR